MCLRFTISCLLTVKAVLFHNLLLANGHSCFISQGKEFETRLKEKKPGNLSEELRTALGMPIGAVCKRQFDSFVHFMLFFIAINEINLIQTTITPILHLHVIIYDNGTAVMEAETYNFCGDL